MPAPILEVANLRKVFASRGRSRPNTVAVHDLSFSVMAGQSLAIVGESGSGKTTTARIIVGLERPTSGRVILAGTERSYRLVRSRKRRHYGRTVQIVFQDPYSSLDPHQSVQSALDEVLRLHFSYSRRDRGERVEDLLNKVGLDQRHGESLPRSLSGGQRQRVGIAKALAAEPDVLILDEAVASLDVSIQAQVLNLLADIREQSGMTFLFISHDLAVVRQVSDEIIVMKEGHVMERGSTDAVLDAPDHPYTKALLEAVPRPGWKPRSTSYLGVSTAPLAQEPSGSSKEVPA